MARCALEQWNLEKVLFVPTGNPRYRRPALASGEHRLAMLRLALAGEPRFAIDERELRAGASGYTYDTVSELKKDFPGESFVLLMGADQYARLRTWHRWKELSALAELAVVPRPRSEIPGTARTIKMEPLNISASDIRARAGRGEDISALVPAAVAEYVKRHALYR